MFVLLDFNVSILYCILNQSLTFLKNQLYIFFPCRDLCALPPPTPRLRLSSLSFLAQALQTKRPYRGSCIKHQISF